jgi:hypothetical protein
MPDYYTFTEPLFFEDLSETEVEGIPVTFVTCNLLRVPKVTAWYLRYLVGAEWLKMLPTNNSYYSSTSYPHRSSHRRPRLRDDRRGAGRETPPSET